MMNLKIQIVKEEVVEEDNVVCRENLGKKLLKVIRKKELIQALTNKKLVVPLLLIKNLLSLMISGNKLRKEIQN
jgi:hypothetical protein